MAADQRRELAAQLRLMARMGARLRRKMGKELRSRYREARKAYRRTGVIGAEMALTGHETAVREILQEQYRRVAETFGRHALNRLKGADAWERKDFEEDLFERLVEEWLENPKNNKIGTDVAAKTRSDIRKIIQEGIAEGLGPAAIAKRMEKKLGSIFAGIRAHVIARTETHSAATFATDAAARAAGIPGLMKQWVAVNDERTRYSHDPNLGGPGEPVQMDAPFMLHRKDGSAYMLMHPGEAGGPADGVIMCRCALVHIPPPPSVLL
jgi:uncharacterized protein with gpF-like domain